MCSATRCFFMAFMILFGVLVSQAAAGAIDRILDNIAGTGVSIVNRKILGEEVDNATFEMQKNAFKFAVDPRSDKQSQYTKNMVKYIQGEDIETAPGDERGKSAAAESVCGRSIGYIFAFSKYREGRKELYVAFFEDNEIKFKRLTDNEFYKRDDTAWSFLHNTSNLVFLRKSSADEKLMLVDVNTGEISPVHPSFRALSVEYDREEKKFKYPKKGYSFFTSKGLFIIPGDENNRNGYLANIITGEKKELRFWKIYLNNNQTLNNLPRIDGRDIQKDTIKAFYDSLIFSTMAQDAKIYYKIDETGLVTHLATCPTNIHKCFRKDITEDGKVFLFSCWHEQEPSELYILNKTDIDKGKSDISKLKRITFNKIVEREAQFLPDGTVAFDHGKYHSSHHYKYPSYRISWKWFNLDFHRDEVQDWFNLVDWDAYSLRIL